MSTTTCPDSHRCKNDSLCVPNPLKEGSYYCDCDIANDSVFAGLSCEHESTQYCTETGDLSKSTFCTNKGTCLTFDAVDAAHSGCACAAGYTGDFCQFTDNQKVPDNWPTLTSEERSTNGANDNTTGGGGDSGGPDSVVIATASIAAVVALMGIFTVALVMRRRRQAAPHVIEKSRTDGSGMHLDSDGDVLSKAMSPTSSNGSTPLSSPRSMDGDDAEVQLDVI